MGAMNIGLEALTLCLPAATLALMAIAAAGMLRTTAVPARPAAPGRDRARNAKIG